MQPAVWARTEPKTILIALAVVAVSFFVSLKAMDWLSPGATLPKAAQVARCRRCRRPRAPPSSWRRSRSLCGAPRCRRHGRAAQLRRQGRQPGRAGAAERRHRLDRLARPDRRDRRPGRAVAVDAADRQAQRDGLAVVEGDRRGQRCDRQPARRQCGQADRQHQHQVAQRQCRNQGQRHHHLAAEARRRLASRAQSSRRRSISATPALWSPAPASTCRPRSSR